MALSQDLISQFAKLTNNESKQNSDTTVNGTYKIIDDKEYVQIDGSDIWTPVTSTVEAETGERVTILLKDHTATVTGNISSPSARTKTVQNLKDEVDAQGNTIKQMDNSITQQNNSIIQMNNSIKQQNDTINSFGNTIDSQNNKIQQYDNTIKQHGDSITSMNNTITQYSNQIDSMNNTIESHNNTIKQHGDTIISQGNTITQQGNLISQQGNTINQHNTSIETANSNISILNSGFKIENGVLTGLSEVIVDELETNTLNAKYANIDFANIEMAAVEKLFSDSGIIKDLIVNEGKITGELVGVTIKGDLIEGNTVKADKLVVRGEDGIYYKLNVDALGETTASSDTKYQNGLDGSVIVANSITAEKVAVTDLVAFGATIGGFHINDHSLYSGAKNSATNTTRGIFLSDDGQLAVGDSTNYLRYFKDSNGNYKLEIGVGGTSIDKAIDDVNNITIGARNLLKGTKTFEVAADSDRLNGFKIDDAYTRSTDDEGFGIISVSQSNKTSISIKSAYSSYASFSAVKNKDVTISFDFMIDAEIEWDQKIPFILEYYNINGTRVGYRDAYLSYEEFNIHTIEPGVWNRLVYIQNLNNKSVTWTNGGSIYTAAYVGVRLTLFKNGSIHFKKLKLEVGNKPTDWTPAPEDVEKNIDGIKTNLANNYYNKTETNAKIKVESDRITSTVSKVTTIENNLNNLEIGGRNLALRTKTLEDLGDINAYKYFVSRSANITKRDDGFSQVHITTGDWKGLETNVAPYNFKPGDKIMLSVNTDIYNLTGKITMYLMQHDSSNTRLYNNILINGAKRSDSMLLNFTQNGTSRLTCSMVWDDVLTDLIANGGRVKISVQFHDLAANGENGYVTLYAPKIEIGSIATDWTPAPEDAEADISDAQNAADAAQSTANNTQTTVTEVQSKITLLSNMIANLVTDENGGSMMTQTSDGWTFNMSSISGNLEAVQNALVDMQANQNDTNNLLEKISNLVDSVAKKTAYITIATDENDDPCIELGKADNPFKVRITNTAIDFLEGSMKIAYANNNTFYSVKIITEELQIGKGPGFVWQTRASGNCGLSYIEG